MLKFTEVVKETMSQKNIRNSDLARMVEHSPQYISDLLSGERRWNEDTINKVCVALGIEIKYEHVEGEVVKNESINPNA